MEKGGGESDFKKKVSGVRAEGEMAGKIQSSPMRGEVKVEATVLRQKRGKKLSVDIVDKRGKEPSVVLVHKIEMVLEVMSNQKSGPAIMDDIIRPCCLLSEMVFLAPPACM